MKTKLILLTLGTFGIVCVLPTTLRAQVFTAPNGNVGIGTTNPAATLDIAGSLRVAEAIVIGGNIAVSNAAGTGKTLAFLRSNLGSAYGIMTPRSDGSGVAFQIADGATYVHQNLFPSVSDGVSLGYPDYRWNYLFVRQIRASSALFDGDVGIGTGSPQAKLDVVGKLRCEVLEVTSDRAAKSKFVSLILPQVLDKIAALEISEWEYTNAPGVRHYGSMAQDFHCAFGLGSDNKHINPLDAASVALAGVQALIREMQRRNDQLARAEAELGALRREMVELKNKLLRQDDVAARVAALEGILAQASTIKK